jgi:hypothetical protein
MAYSSDPPDRSPLATLVSVLPPLLSHPAILPAEEKLANAFISRQHFLDHKSNEDLLQVTGDDNLRLEVEVRRNLLIEAGAARWEVQPRTEWRAEEGEIYVRKCVSAEGGSVAAGLGFVLVWEEGEDGHDWRFLEIVHPSPESKAGPVWHPTYEAAIRAAEELEGDAESTTADDFWAGVSDDEPADRGASTTQRRRSPPLTAGDPNDAVCQSISGLYRLWSRTNDSPHRKSVFMALVGQAVDAEEAKQ